MSWTHEGDMAQEVARKLETEHLEAIANDGEGFVDQEAVMWANSKSILSKITFRWRADEKSQLERIRAAVDTVISDLYADAKNAIDSFYLELRVPEVDVNGVPIRDNQGRIAWVCDRDGKPVEDWSQMTGQDIEECLMTLSRIRIQVACQVNELLMEAVFAKHIHDDQFQDAFSELVEETIPGRNAYAARKTRQDKYRAFFHYYLWSSAKAFQSELTNFCWVLEKVRNWRIEDGKGGKTTTRF